MLWIIAAVLVLMWMFGWAFYSAYQRVHRFLTHLVTVAEEFYSLSQRT